MIQELLGEAAAGVLIGGERSKHSVHNGVLGGSSASPSLSPSPSPSPSPSSSTVNTPPTGSSCTSENLRCPRCDSTNTKFCYYNNYNLTQPRHFCKTCRRYWTKGGALRNVPIGGGCRKNKATTITSAVMKSSAGKFKNMATEIGKSGFLSGFEHELSSPPPPSSNPMLWASPQNCHLLSLLRANQNLNPSPNASSPISNSIVGSIKEEAAAMHGPHMSSAVALNARIIGMDSLGQVPSLGLTSSSSFWRNNEQQQQIGFILGEGQSSGVQDFYQRIRTSTNCYPDSAPVLVGNVVSSSSSSASNMTILDSAPVAAAEPGYWNPILSSWSGFPTTGGAYP